MAEQTSVTYVDQSNMPNLLTESGPESLDFIVFLAGGFRQTPLADIYSYLSECVRTLKNGGILFVQGTPPLLAEIGAHLDRLLTFKYWIAVESAIHRPTHGLPSVHAGILLFTKGNGRFNLHPFRFPHEYCAFCGKPLRDWGGKTHLMNPGGYTASDVWKAMTPADNYSGLSAEVLEHLLKLVDAPQGQQEAHLSDDDDALSPRITPHGIVGPSDCIHTTSKFLAEPRGQYCLPGLESLGLPGRPINTTARPSKELANLYNVVLQGDAVEVLRKYPDNSIDLVFADPPYNLDKAYGIYDDERRRDDYLNWCNTWLAEYVRIIKPTGSLYVLNLPRWTMYHAAFLNQLLFFQNWIVWDALSEPRGKLMPAHYGLLLYTKQPTDFTFNYQAVGKRDSRSYCLRAACIRSRKAQGVDSKEAVTDIWTDVHRLKHRRDRDHHPCQLPDALLERIIRLSSNPGDVVLDALAGTGTTAVMAAKLGRHYVAIDIDDAYVQIAQDKLSQVERLGHVSRQSTRRPRPQYAKKTLQLELRDLAMRLGRLPTPEDIQTSSRFGIDAFRDAFPTWGKALKAAKLINNHGEGTYDTAT